MDQETELLVRKLAAEVAAEVASNVAAKVTDQLEHRLNVHFERTFDLVKRTAEGYGATLESLDRRLDRLERNWTARFGDHESLLRNHEQRITGLEQSR